MLERLQGGVLTNYPLELPSAEDASTDAVTQPPQDDPAETEARHKSGMFPEALDAIAAYREYAPGSIFLIPVRLSQCEIPPLEIDGTRTLDRLQYVDLFPVGKRSAGLQRLIKALRATAQHP